MNTIRKTAACLMAVAMAFTASQAAADESVARRLDARGIKYEVDADGDYKVTYNYEKDGRTQLVFVSGRTEEIGEFRVREVFAPAARIESDGVDGARALKLMAHSRQLKLGAWEILGDVLYLVIKLPEDLSAEDLEKAMDIAAETADDMEIEISGDADNL